MSDRDAVFDRVSSPAHRTLLVQLADGGLIRARGPDGRFELIVRETTCTLAAGVVEALENDGWLEMDLLGDYRIAQHHTLLDPR